MDEFEKFNEFDEFVKISILFLLVSNLGAYPFTVLFSHVEES